MKNVLIIKPHSFVDLITNSSSELFVCETKKSIDSVKEILEKIVRNHYDILGEPCPEIWGEVFQEKITTTEYTIAPQQVADYKDYYEAIREKLEHEEASKRRLLWEKFFGEAKFNWYAPEGTPVDTAQKYDEKRSAITRKIWDKQEKMLDSYITDKLGLAITTKSDLMWGIHQTKGDLMVLSAEDNSIPYECFSMIERVLNAQRYHLG